MNCSLVYKDMIDNLTLFSFDLFFYDKQVMLGTLSLDIKTSHFQQKTVTMIAGETTVL